MRRHLTVALAVLFLLSGAFALTLNVKTIPGAITPGTSGKMIFEISSTSGARGIEMVVDDSTVFDVEDAGRRIDIGDVMGGTISYVLWFSVPSNAKPGVYVLPVEITYEDPSTGQSYTEHFAPILEIVSGKGVSVELPDKVYGGIRQKIRIKITNTGATIYSATLTVPDAMGENDIYIGDIESGETVEKYVEILPTCSDGLYKANLTLEGYRGTDKITENLTYTTLCIPPEADLRVNLNIPQKISGGEQNTTLEIINGTSVPQGPITITITGVNVRLGGKTAYYINSIEPKGIVRIPVIWKLEKSDEPGSIDVVLSTPTGERTYSFSVLPEDEPEISVYLADVPKWEGGKLKAVIAVANVGTGTAENVFVETNSPKAFGGKDLIGDLAPGDYDTTTVYLLAPEKQETIHVRVEYTAYGQKKSEEFDVTINVPEQPANNTMWIILAVLAVVGIWWWRRKRK